MHHAQTKRSENENEARREATNATRRTELPEGLADAPTYDGASAEPSAKPLWDNLSDERGARRKRKLKRSDAKREAKREANDATKTFELP